MTKPTIRRTVRPCDLAAVIALHERVYPPEFDLDPSFASHVKASVDKAAQRGFPRPREAAWLVERDGRLSGSLALTDEGDDVAAVRWFVLEPDLRGQGLGSRLLADLMRTARAAGYVGIGLETFSELRSAAHLYRQHGFELVSADTGARWGREITYQRYELSLASGMGIASSAWASAGTISSGTESRATTRSIT
jgi:GNAT superfamily N-acetyltransferase